MGFYLGWYDKKANSVSSITWITIIWEIWEIWKHKNNVIFNNEIVDDLKIFVRLSLEVMELIVLFRIDICAVQVLSKFIVLLLCNRLD